LHSSQGRSRSRSACCADMNDRDRLGGAEQRRRIVERPVGLAHYSPGRCRRTDRLPANGPRTFRRSRAQNPRRKAHAGQRSGAAAGLRQGVNSGQIRLVGLCGLSASSSRPSPAAAASRQTQISRSALALLPVTAGENRSTALGHPATRRGQATYGRVARDQRGARLFTVGRCSGSPSLRSPGLHPYNARMPYSQFIDGSFMPIIQHEAGPPISAADRVLACGFPLRGNSPNGIQTLYIQRLCTTRTAIFGCRNGFFPAAREFPRSSLLPGIHSLTGGAAPAAIRRAAAAAAYRARGRTGYGRRHCRRSADAPGRRAPRG
jgi:hypothetical protein